MTTLIYRIFYLVRCLSCGTTFQFGDENARDGWALSHLGTNEFHHIQTADVRRRLS